ncbi:MAG: peptidoglycan DD-metalloendopeptidase family protein [Parcubacteria group bacterium]|nr:peptidoglycan DD-metalloendopeptidase family protein [Parcubacteria group bacterium]
MFKKEIRTTKAIKIVLLTGFIFSSFYFGIPKITEGATVSELKAKIEETQRQRELLDKEIQQYQGQIDATNKQAQTLQNAIKTLDITQKKLNTDLKIAQNSISNTTLTIEQLGIEIDKKKEDIENNVNEIEVTIRKINEAEDKSLIESFFVYKNLNLLWDDIETMQRFQIGIRENIADLKVLQKDLENKRGQSEKKKSELVDLKSTLADQKKIVESNKQQKDSLLTSTKNTEANYKKILAQKQALAAAFDKELVDFQSQLKLIIDPKSIPSVGKGILFWPLDKIRITQYFGNTEFSKTTTAYNGKGHNGVDFGVSVGASVKAALSGVVEGVGNTDNVCPGASYGKWVLIKHSNGLSTLYAHLSLIKMQAGQKVDTGDTIGYSGNTGYSTGPHLHFSVFVSQGVQIKSLKSRVCSGTYTIPIAPLNAYLNPLSYL